MKEIYFLIFIFSLIHINIARALNNWDLIQEKLNENSLSDLREDEDESDSERIKSLRMLNSNSPLNFGSDSYFKTMNFLYNRLAINNFMNSNGYLRPNPFNNRKMPTNDENENDDNGNNSETNNNNDDSNQDGNFGQRRQVAPLNRRNRNHPSQRRRFNGNINNDNYNIRTSTPSALSTSTLPTLNLTLHVNKKDGKNFKGMNVNLNLLNNKRYFNNNQPTPNRFEFEENEDDEALKLLTTLLKKKIRLSDDQQTLFVPRNSRPNSVMDRLSLYNEDLNQHLIPMAAGVFFTQDNVEDTSINANDYKNVNENHDYGADDKYGYRNDNYLPETTTLRMDDTRFPFSRLNLNTTPSSITVTRIDDVMDFSQNESLPIPDGVLTVISNNNNNVNINEDKYSIDELLDLINTFNNKLTKNDLISYDYNRKQKLLLMRDQPSNGLPLRLLKSQIIHGPDYNKQVEKEQEVVLKTNSSSTGLSKHGEIFKDIADDLSYTYYPFHNGGLIIINNVNGNLNRKIKKILGNTINITNRNSPLFLPIEYLSDEEIDNLLQNAVIVNNDNNNNNIS